MKIKTYNRNKVVEYAEKWAYLRNPSYYNYDNLGGDCTNFASQSIYVGSNVMNYSNIGWFYNNANNKSPSWTGVEFLYNFLINNKSVGPFGKVANINEIRIGDIAQLSFDGKKFSHTLVIVNIFEPINLENILVATHTFDSYGRSISSYDYQKIRYINREGVRDW